MGDQSGLAIVQAVRPRIISVRLTAMSHQRQPRSLMYFAECGESQL